MNTARWHRIQLLVEGALEQPEGASRRAFVESECGGDIELRDEAISLLAACERSDETHALPTAWLGLLAAPKPARFSTGEHVARRYRIERLLGRGGMGEVYEAWDEELFIPVALKTLHLESGTEDAHKRLKLEGILARSVWHPNVCRFYDLGRHGDGKGAVWFLTMELLRGETLAGELQKGKLPLDRAQRLAQQMAAGLGAAHRAGVVHRDFKPDNVVLVTRDGGEQAVVTDFGIARAASRRAAGHDPSHEAGPIVGTPAYMAPEQVRGEEVGPAADIYALGCVLYETVTGTVPFTGDSAIDVARRRLREEPPSPRRLVPDLDDRWEAVILRCLTRDPRRRFARAEEVADALGGSAPLERAESIEPSAGAWRTLPVERDSFVGRAMEVEELTSWFAGGSRFVTLAGAGGMGKTRLAIHYAWRNLGDWPGGVWFCDLTESRDLDGIASSVAGSLGIQLGSGDPVVQLGHAIAGRGRCLMVLDNFEQVVDQSAETVGRWLTRAAEARFLVTSREKLGLGDQEKVLALGPLSIETGTELLVARMRRLLPGREVTGDEAESAREIVRLVDGMPLAIELAGARMRVMSAAQIVAQMRRRFSLLTGGGSARHETLAVAIDGSWELLKPWEQSAWAQCAVFEGGFTLEAAEGVIDLRAWPDAPWVVDVVQSLVDKSLLRTWVPAGGTGEGMAEARFGMFVSLQEYAHMKLRENPSLTGARSSVPADRAAEQRHGEWYARFGAPHAIQALKEERNPGQGRRVERELDNLITACRRAIGRGDAATATATFSASWAILDSRGPFRVAVDLGRAALRELNFGKAEEARVVKALAQAEWFSGMVEACRAHQEAALALSREIPDRHLEALVLGDIGSMHVHRGQMEEGSIHLESALEIARAVGDRHLECNALSALSVARRGQGRTNEARACAERALEVARSAGYWRLEGSALSNLGLILQDQGRTDEARAHYEAALAILREAGVRRLEASVRSNLGGLCLDQGRLADARVHLDAALIINREAGSRFSESIVLTNLGSLCHAQGRAEDARTHLETALGISRELGNRGLEGSILGALGHLHEDRGEAEAARTHYESALAIHRAVNDRRAEGSTLARMASLLRREGSHDAAREAVVMGERLLRQADAPLELGQLLCIRAELEQDSGDAAAAVATLREAEDLADRIRSGPDSQLGRMIAKLRQTLVAR
jgi:predicted ATPase/Tfp pilus assembly protein PilF